MIFETEVNFENANIGGALKTSVWTFFNNDKFPTRFSHMKAGTVELYAGSFTLSPLIDGMSYDDWANADRHELLKLLEKAKYKPNAYATAEAFLKNNGEAALADEVFIHQKNQRT